MLLIASPMLVCAAWDSVPCDVCAAVLIVCCCRALPVTTTPALCLLHAHHLSLCIDADSIALFLTPPLLLTWHAFQERAAACRPMLKSASPQLTIITSPCNSQA
jgi:hypothetical protein